MFKILTLNTGVDAQLQALQNQWEIEAVENLGTDSVMNHYLLVQYDVQPPSASTPATPTSGSASVSTESATDKKPAPKKAGK